MKINIKKQHNRIKFNTFTENRIKIEDPDTKQQLYNYKCNILQEKKTTLDSKWVLFKENENIYVMFITNI